MRKYFKDRRSIFFKNDIRLIYILFLVSIIIRYFTPIFVGNIYFYLVLIIFYSSNKNYFWIAFIFLLIDPPGYLFAQNSIVFHLPFIPAPGTGRDIHYVEIFLFIALLKALKYKKNIFKKSFVFQLPFILLIIYMIFLLILSFYFGISFYRFFNTVRHIAPFLFIFILPRLLNKRDDYNKLFNILFSFVFIVLASQIYEILTGSRLAFLVGETKIVYSGNDVFSNVVLDPSEKVIRTFYSYSILMISNIGAMFFSMSKNSPFKKNYLYLIIFLCMASIFLSATRGWIIAFLIMFLLFFFLQLKNPIPLLKRIGIILLIATLLIAYIPRIRIQVYNALDRFETVKYLLTGDITAGGTLIRLNERSPRVMNKYYESPIVGWGFSDEFFKYADPHVGNQTILLNGGIIGYSLFVVFWLAFIFKIYSINKSLFYDNTYKKSLLVLIIGLLGILAAHSTSAGIFSYLIQVPAALSLVLFFVFSDFILNQAVTENRKLLKTME